MNHSVIISDKILEFLREDHKDPEKIELCKDIKIILTVCDQSDQNKPIYMDDLNKRLRSYNLPEIW